MSYKNTLVCKVCQKEYLQTRKNQQFCSRKCYGEYRHQVAISGNHPFARIIGTKKICPVCGIKYTEPKNRISRTCSRKCWSILMHGENNVKYKPKIKVTCKQCGKELEIQPCLKNRKHFCSDECKYKWRSENIKGSKVHNWLGGKSFGKYCEKFNPEFKERVRIFFKRKCFECGSDEIKERHHVHHIQFNPKACCDNSERLFIILCRNCHAVTTNSSDREEIARYYSLKLYEATGGKCWYTVGELAELQLKISNLENLNRWELTHLML